MSKPYTKVHLPPRGHTRKSQKKYKQKKEIEDHRPSKYIASTRLSTLPGIFVRGNISDRAVRDSLYKHQTVARAEGKLSRILQLARIARASDKNESDCFSPDYELRSPLNTSVLNTKNEGNHFDKRITHFGKKGKFACDKTHRSKPQFSSKSYESLTNSSERDDTVESYYNAELEINDDKPTLKTRLLNNCMSYSQEKVGNHLAPQTGFQSDIPYGEFGNKIRKSLQDAASALAPDCDLFSILQKRVEEMVLKSAVHHTPPPSSKRILSYHGHYLGKSTDNERKQNPTPSSSSSALTPNFDEGKTFLVSPQGLIRRFELRKYSPVVKVQNRIVDISHMNLPMNMNTKQEIKLNDCQHVTPMPMEKFEFNFEGDSSFLEVTRKPRQEFCLQFENENDYQTGSRKRKQEFKLKFDSQSGFQNITMKPRHDFHLKTEGENVFQNATERSPNFLTFLHSKSDKSYFHNDGSPYRAGSAILPHSSTSWNNSNNENVQQENHVGYTSPSFMHLNIGSGSSCNAQERNFPTPPESLTSFSQLFSNGTVTSSFHPNISSFRHLFQIPDQQIRSEAGNVRIAPPPIGHTSQSIDHHSYVWNLNQNNVAGLDQSDWNKTQNKRSHFHPNFAEDIFCSQTSNRYSSWDSSGLTVDAQTNLIPTCFDSVIDFS